MSSNYMTHSIREAAQALIDAIDAKLNDVIPYEQLADLRSALSAPQPTADERIAEHMRFAQAAIHAFTAWCDGQSRACGARFDEAFAAVEQSARALLSASQEDAEHAAMYRWLRDNREGQMQDGTMLYGDELDAAIRAAMKETK